MKTIVRDGATLAYEITGPLEGLPVVLGHSLVCDGRMWEGVAPALAAAGFRVINVDARGHGHSSVAGAFTLEDLAADWLAILDAEKLPRAALVGLSMGGMTAMRLALLAPSRVAALALIDTSADPEIAVKRARYWIMAEVTRRFGHLGFIMGRVKTLMLGRTFLAKHPDQAAREVARLAESDPKNMRLAVRAVFQRGPIRDRLGAITAPVLVIHGSEDLAIPRVHAERITSAIPQAKLQAIYEAGHLSAVEQPAIVADLLIPFLKSAATSP